MRNEYEIQICKPKKKISIMKEMYSKFQPAGGITKSGVFESERNAMVIKPIQR